MSSTWRLGGAAKRNAPHCTPKTAELTPQHGTLSTRLDEISGSLGVPRKLYFGPDPLSDPQIDPLRPHLEKFPACGAQRVPAALPLRGGRCLPAPCLKCGF